MRKVEGFKKDGVKLTPEYSHYVFRVLSSGKSIKKQCGSTNDIQSFGQSPDIHALDEAVEIANRLAK